MTWHPTDLVSDADLIAYERTVLTQFAASDWAAKRQKAIEDWLFPLLTSRGYDPQRLVTRVQPSAVLRVAASVAFDVTTNAQTADGIALASTFTDATDALYVGAEAPFFGVSVRQLDTPNATGSAIAWSQWADAWRAVSGLRDLTTASGVPFATGGSITWTPPEGLIARTLHGAGPYYWARVTMATPPAAGKIGPLAVIRRSRLCAAAAMRTLALIMREAPATQDGPWDIKAEWYEAESERAWLRVADVLAGEFDSDNDLMLSPTEQTTQAPAPWRWERG